MKARKMAWQRAWLEHFYYGRAGWQNGTTLFHAMCALLAKPRARILEIGAGPTNSTSAYLASLGELHGVDRSDEVHGNADLFKSAVIDGERYPYEDAAFDIAVSNYVVEHVADPRGHLAEIHRVLRPGGYYVFRTPNLLHYVAIVSRFTPHAFHRLTANRLRNLDTKAHDPWPTVYAMNTPQSVRKHASRSGFHVHQLEMVEKEPSYGMYARSLFLAFMAYERAVNASPLLSPLRANMFVALHKR